MARHRRLVVACWLGAALLGAVGAARLGPLLSNTFSVPGADSGRAEQILARSFHDRSEGSFLVVAAADQAGPLARALQTAGRAVPTATVGPVAIVGRDLLVGQVVTELPLARAKRFTPAVRSALGIRGARVDVTGAPALQHDLDAVLAGDLHHGEYEIALPVALAVLLWVLGVSWIVTLPLLFAAATIESSLGVVYALAHWLPMASYVSNLVELIGLGLAVDYSLLIVYRFRDELAHGLSVEDATVRTMLTAGRSVIFSGAAVAVGLALLLFIPIPFVRSLGLGGLLIPLSSIAASITLLPALLAGYGRRGSQRYSPRARRHQAVRGLARRWEATTRAILRRPALTLALSSAVLALAVAPVFFLQLTPGSVEGVPRFPESVRAFHLLTAEGEPGLLYPTRIVVDAGPVARPAARAATGRLRLLLRRDTEVASVSQPVANPTGRYTELLVGGRDEYGSGAAQRFVARIRGTLVPEAAFPAGAKVLVGGGPAQGYDFIHVSYSIFPWLIAAVLACTYILLVGAFRSLVLPLKAIVLNVLSVAASYGVLVVVFQWGVGHALLGLYRAPRIDAWIPIFLFSMLFGLSMDYEVFLVTRMREAWDEGLQTRSAVTAGLTRTGPIISAAALIMTAAFSGFITGRIADLQQFGVGLAAAIFFDATLIRLLLVPSLMGVLGELNWWLPGWIQRLLPRPRLSYDA
jgi:RND superfamily putative drug exporter